ncbi:RNA-directed DNA polymerase, eukaryota, reverse transcriptase zinc-binding domain protein [Tanacetum coccineum]|uniref:RNA-directed DNA polymerase, eukaryota, reverse transcriptase zinc-binding domain protein n=1 Tax=Tanacetum coccineum TaxID=301880 RepID=A0ABQ5D120_9ASTR
MSTLHLSSSQDTWKCCLNGTNEFPVTSLRQHIFKQSQSLPSSNYKWNNLLPSKVNITTWRISIQRLPTHINLDKRNVNLDSVRCPICDDALKTEQHVFVSCNLAGKIWKDILNWWNIKNSVVSTFDDAINLAGKVTIKALHIKFFDAVVQTTLWLLSRYQNEFVFSAKRPKIELLLNDVKSFSFQLDYE